MSNQVAFSVNQKGSSERESDIEIVLSENSAQARLKYFRHLLKEGHDIKSAEEIVKQKVFSLNVTVIS